MGEWLKKCELLGAMSYFAAALIIDVNVRPYDIAHIFGDVEMTIDRIIALAASIGACLSAVATFLTVRQIAKQRQASYYPELALSRIAFEGSTSPIATGALPTFWTKHAADGRSEQTIQKLRVPLQNVGLGTAKAVEISWSFPIADVVARVNLLAQRTLTPAYFTYVNGCVSVKWENLGDSFSYWGNQKSASIDFVLPAAVRSEPVELILPHAYILLCSALLFFGMKGKNGESFPEIPDLRVSFECIDIGEQKHHAEFDIAFHLIAIGLEGDAMHGFLEPKKVMS